MPEKSNERRNIAGRVAGAQFAARIEFAAAIEQVSELPAAGADEDFVAPGFVDLQVNGFAGVDYNDPEVTSEAFAASIQRLFRTGVTRFFPTIITASPERMAGALRKLAEAKREFRRCGMPEADGIAGFHVEGPHISCEDGPRGAHPREHVRPPDLDEFQRWQEATEGEVRLVTLSPEYDSAPRYISALVRAGVVVSIGHTAANAEQIGAAADAGATMSTHLGNGAHPMLPRTSSYVWDQMAEDRLTASLIADGLHIRQAFLKCAIRMKGAGRSVIITDALTPAMCEPGIYTSSGRPVELLPDNRVVLWGSELLAGSALSMDRGVSNCERLGGVSLQVALEMATVNPARAVRMAGRERGLETGEAADLIRFKWDQSSHTLTVLETIVAGKTVHKVLSC